MGTHTMGSQGASGGGGGATTAGLGGVGSSGGTVEPKSHALTRQGSLYNLTLDEVQHQLGDLGKPLSSMNLDELLKSVWTVETNQGMGNVDYTPASISSLHRQSSLTLSRDLSKKTVDEVWQDIQQGQKKDNHDRRVHERHPTLGEITLEDFLVKAGIVAESSPGKKNPGPILGSDQIVLPQQSIPQQAQWMPYQQNQHNNMMAVYIPGHPIQPLPIGGNQIIDAVYPEPQMSMSPSALMGTLSDTQTPGRKRVASGDVVEKTVERRQKRMIKNRESAARSRARKQAYTHELENKVSRLEEENERLKKQKEVEKVLRFELPPEPKYQLRRTSSSPF